MISIFPSKKDFIEGAKEGRLTPVYAELPFALPQDIFERVGLGEGILLESIKGPERIARYSFIGCDPFMSFRVKDGVITEHSGTGDTVTQGHPLKRLRQIMGRYRIEHPAFLPPFTGGAAGLLSYDFVHYFERLPCSVIDDLGMPDAHFLFFDTVVAIDHILGKSYIISCPGARSYVLDSAHGPVDWSDMYEQACSFVQALNSRIFARIADVHYEGRPGRSIDVIHEMSRERYMDIVRQTKSYIKAGDIFQANLSQRVSADIGSVSPWQVYKILSRINPAPFACFLNMGDYAIAGSSPERLVKVSDGMAETRPIAGTRPRGMDDVDDRRMRADLLLNEKERAEHLMLIDLERNDLGRISDYGSVHVDELMITEDYSHVIHIVSNVIGRMANDCDCLDALKATFPGGTITGVPKVRCMEIIDELEPVARGPYTGSAGYISFSGNMDLNIIIRTFVIKAGSAYVQAGAGIVADSDPEREYHETLKKAEALIRTLEVL